jgi:glycerophosphoryl diester phosphodiesterase
MGVDVHGARTVARYEQQERIPLLAEVLSEVAGKLAINVEIKTTFSFWKTEISRIVADVIAQTRAVHSVIVTSFDPRKLRAAVDAHPDLATGFCFDDSMLDFANPLLSRMPQLRNRLSLPADSHLRTNARRLLSRILDTHLLGKLLGWRVVGAEHTIISSETVKRLHAQGIAVGTHTLFPLGSTTGKPISPSAMTAAEVDRLVALGVDWIESDDPERLLKLVAA